ncbi:MAG: sigma 54-interacting transcriptional regulator, partial [Desulfatiglans sp.]|nr:sigma 54-interacting transcriptional regulator [Desulfatiglans sp.]
WFSRRITKKGPVLRSSCNLSQADVDSKAFRSNLAMVFKAYRDNRPQVARHEDNSHRPNQAKAVLCLPFQVRGHVQGVLYHDNSFVKDCFDYFDGWQLVRIAQSITSYVENISGMTQRMERKVSINLRQLGQANAPEILTESPMMLKTLDESDRIAASDSTVLILGETGVGKELLTQRIHRMSLRKGNPFVVVDPTTMPESLIESELFGHEKGAFTGADRQKPGRLELANHGTLFIDEVGEIPKAVQSKLLRALQEKTFVRVGGTKTIFADFRLVAATNRDLAEEVAAGRFREDLYYRINVVQITIPPLRERIEDVPLLARLFLERYAAKHSRPRLQLSLHDEELLMIYHWPGNVRELQNVIERAVILCDGDRIKLHLPTGNDAMINHSFKDMPTLDELQRRYISYTLEKTKGKISGANGAAEVLGMKRSSLYNRMRKLGLR